MYGIVYKVTNTLTGQIYIGITTASLDERMARHIRSSRSKSKRKCYFHRALAVYNKESFIWEILESCESKEQLIAREQFYILYYQSYRPDKGYNLTYGGDGCYANIETRRKISLALKGRKHADETKKKIGQSMLATKKANGKLKHSLETRRKISASLTGKTIPPETRRKISQGMTGNKNNQGRGKPVIKLDKNGRVIERFDSLTSAARLCQLDRASISACCSGRRKSCGGFIWRTE